MVPSQDGILNVILFVACCLLLASCDIINPDEPTPSYLHINNIQLKTDYSIEGTASHNITDAWVYVDNDLIGMYELPATLPVLKKGVQNIKVRAGIKQNGISDTRVFYPFYDFYDTTRQLSPLKVDTLQPVVEYLDQNKITFAWIEDFESGNSIEKVGSPATIERTPSGASPDFLKNWVGKITLNSSADEFFGQSLQQFPQPDNNKEVYLELNYKCSHEFSVGITGEINGKQRSQLKVTINEKNYWNKIYIDFSKEIQQYTGDYKIIFSTRKPDSISSAEIYLDNLKLIHFQ